MAPLKNLENSTSLNLRSMNTKLVLASFLLLLSLIILLISPSMESNPFHVTTLAATLTSQLISLDSPNSTGSGLVNPTQNLTQPPTNPNSDGSGLASPAPTSPREKGPGSCDVFDGTWVFDHEFDPIYLPGSCPFVNHGFACFNNGRPDLEYLKYRWQPYGCDIPRFDGKRMLEILRGKRMVFVGDSLNRNMWESLVCSLRESLVDKNRVFKFWGRGRSSKIQGLLSFKFKDYNCSIEFIMAPFLVQQWTERGKETLRLDMMQATASNYHDADYLIFNTGHWWNHHKTVNGENYFQEGDIVHKKLDVGEAYTKALLTWANWVDKNVDVNRTRVFFSGYSAMHFRGGQWNSGGTCDEETKPITNDKYLAPYPWIMTNLESIMLKMKTPVVYLNITKLTDYRKDGHPSIYRKHGATRRPGMIQDCSHWCLPGVPDSWNQLLYALLLSLTDSSRIH